jgi:hypothetical protein
MLPTLKIWMNHFDYHSGHPRRLPEGIPNVLTRDERKAIAASIATFQLGEQSSGSNLLRAAYQFSQEHDAGEVARIIELLIREEQQHAALLGAFMAEHGIPAKRHDWTDRMFRRIRKLAELELTLGVLMTAELIGNVYYRALEMATDCQRLRLLCRMLVADELAHVGFESDLLMAMRSRRSASVRLAVDLAHRTFFLGTAMVVWATHRPVLRRAGYGMLTFLAACRAQYRFYLQPPQLKQIKPCRRSSASR